MIPLGRLSAPLLDYALLEPQLDGPKGLRYTNCTWQGTLLSPTQSWYNTRRRDCRMCGPRLHCTLADCSLVLLSVPRLSGQPLVLPMTVLHWHRIGDCRTMPDRSQRPTHWYTQTLEAAQIRRRPDCTADGQLHCNRCQSLRRKSWALAPTSARLWGLQMDSATLRKNRLNTLRCSCTQTMVLVQPSLVRHRFRHSQPAAFGATV